MACHFIDLAHQNMLPYRISTTNGGQTTATLHRCVPFASQCRNFCNTQYEVGRPSSVVDIGDLGAGTLPSTYPSDVFTSVFVFWLVPAGQSGY